MYSIQLLFRCVTNWYVAVDVETKIPRLFYSVPLGTQLMYN